MGCGSDFGLQLASRWLHKSLPKGPGKPGFIFPWTCGIRNFEEPSF
jgi:hypothetical protein